MKYKDRRQRGPDQPVELLEFRPTLVPAILVNKLWADEGTSILWKRYPHLPAFKVMDIERRQNYANKVQQIFSLSPPPGHPEQLDYLDNLEWPNLKSLELEIDFIRHGAKFLDMIHPGLELLELSGVQSGGSAYFAEVVLSSLFSTCQSLQTIRFGSGIFLDDDPVHIGVLFEYLENIQSINSVEVKSTGFMGTDSLFTRLSQRAGLKGLAIDLEPGIMLLPQLEGPNALPSPFASLKRLDIMCYPEIALSLLGHLSAIEELQLDICRIPEHPVQESDYSIFDDIFAILSSTCLHLRSLKLSVGLLAIGFPSFSTFPKLSGDSLVRLARNCSKLEDFNVFATEPSAIDGSGISSDDFDMFCEALPNLRNLVLKLHPTTALALTETALQSLGKHCHELDVLRLKIPFQLSSLPVSSTLPQSLVSVPVTPTFELDNGVQSTEVVRSSAEKDLSSANDITPSLSPSEPIPALFTRLTQLAIARPETALAITDDSFTSSSGSYSEVVDPEVEESLVRSWAHALLTHFPHLEVLEAWGDWSGEDNESLNYFLPTEEIMASTWEFLSGAEQDLWNDDEDVEEDEGWQAYETSSGGDWDAASSLNEYTDVAHPILASDEVEEEPEGMITPGRTIDKEELFKDASKRDSLQLPVIVSHTDNFDSGHHPEPDLPGIGARDLGTS
jgi:hypothetical protein